MVMRLYKCVDSFENIVIAEKFYKGEYFANARGDWLEVEGKGFFRFYRFRLATSEEKKIYENELEMMFPTETDS